MFYFRVWIFLKNFLCAACISVKLEHFGKKTTIFENLQFFILEGIFTSLWDEIRCCGRWLSKLGPN